MSILLNGFQNIRAAIVYLVDSCEHTFASEHVADFELDWFVYGVEYFLHLLFIDNLLLCCVGVEIDEVYEMGVLLG